MYYTSVMRKKVVVFVVTFVLAYGCGPILLCVDEGQSPNAIPKFCAHY